MQRTTLSVPGPLLQRLELLAAERGTSMAELVREAIEEKIARHRHRPRPRSLGSGASGVTDTARRSGDDRPEPRS